MQKQKQKQKKQDKYKDNWALMALLSGANSYPAAILLFLPRKDWIEGPIEALTGDMGTSLR